MTFPPASTIVRSTIESSVSRSCVTMNTVSPRLSLNTRTRRSKARALMGSSPDVGSSRNRISGSRASARASATRLRMPPDSSAGAFVAVSGGNPTSASLKPTSGGIKAAGRSVCSWNGTAIFSATVSEENSAPS